MEMAQSRKCLGQDRHGLGWGDWISKRKNKHQWLTPQNL